VFCSMIVFTLMYAGLLRPLINTGDASGIPSPWKAILAIHIGVQIAFTLTAHSRERFEKAQAQARWPLWWLAGLLITAVAAGVFVRTADITWGGLSLGEVGYRLFIMAYGAIFPAYVLLCMLPTLRQGICPVARKRVFIAAVIVGYPLGVMGFVAGPAHWLLGLYAVFVVGRVVVELLPESRSAA